MSALADVVDVAVGACEGDQSDAMALLAGAAYELAFHAADEAALRAKPEDAPYAPIDAVRRPAGRLLRRVAEQMATWAGLLEAIEGHDLPMMRKRIHSFADRDARDLAGRLKLALRRGSQSDPAPAPESVALDEPAQPTRAPARRSKAPPCAKCGAMMLPEDGRYGPYRRCENPECRSTTLGHHLGVACLARDCDGHLIERLGKGDQRMVIGCSNYPPCRFAVYQPIERVPCFFCKLPFLLIEDTGRRRCIDPTCVATGAIAKLDRATEATDIFSLAVRVTGSLEDAAMALTTAGGFACASAAQSEADAITRFVSAYALGARANEASAGTPE